MGIKFFQSKSKHTEAQQLFDRVWQLLLKERGQNRLRGRWVREPERLRIGLEFEAVADEPPGPMLWLILGTTWQDCYYVDGGQRVSAPDVGSLEAWVKMACRTVRRRQAYVRTREDRADYK